MTKLLFVVTAAIFIVGLYSIHRPTIDIVLTSRGKTVLFWYTVYREDIKIRTYIVLFKYEKNKNSRH